MAAETLTFEGSRVTTLGDSLIPAVNLTSTANALDKYTFSLTSLQSDLQIDIDFLFAKLTAFVLLSTVGGTLETNTNNAAGGDTVTFLANDPFIWRSGGYGSNPFTANVSTAFLTNTDAAAGTVEIWVLRNPLT